MASRKSSSRRAPSPPPDLENFDNVPDFESSDASANINRLLSQFGEGEIVCKVYEVKSGGEEHFKYSIISPTPDKVSEDSVRKVNRGRGGVFKLRFIVDGECRTTQELFIADSPEFDAAALLAPGAASVGSAGEQLLLQRLASIESQLQARSRVDREPILDMVEAMVKIQALNPAKPDMSVDTILKCIELGKSLGGSPAGATSEWGEIFKDVAKSIGPGLLPLLMGGRAPEQAASGSLAPQPEEQERMLKQQLLKQGIEYLKKKCTMGSSPDLYLEMILDNAEEYPYSHLVHLAATSEFSAFEAIDPDIAQPAFRPFFLTIFDGLRQQLSQPSDVAGNSGGSNGNAGNASGNGGTDTGGGG